MNIAVLILFVVVALGAAGYMIVRRRGGLNQMTAGLRTEPLKICPQLGLAGDPFENAGRPDDDHRCYANLARERIDRGHQQMFCLSASYKRCPFLAVAPRQDGMFDRARAWWRTVSPGRPALAISQPGLRPWLGALAAMLSRVSVRSVSLPSMPSVPRVQAPSVAALLKKRPVAQSSGISAYLPPASV